MFPSSPCTDTEVAEYLNYTKKVGNRLFNYKNNYCASADLNAQKKPNSSSSGAGLPPFSFEGSGPYKGFQLIVPYYSTRREIDHEVLPPLKTTLPKPSESTATASAARPVRSLREHLLEVWGVQGQALQPVSIPLKYIPSPEWVAEALCEFNRISLRLRSLRAGAVSVRSPRRGEGCALSTLIQAIKSKVAVLHECGDASSRFVACTSSTEEECAAAGVSMATSSELDELATQLSEFADKVADPGSSAGRCAVSIFTKKLLENDIFQWILAERASSVAGHGNTISSVASIKRSLFNLFPLQRGSQSWSSFLRIHGPTSSLIELCTSQRSSDSYDGYPRLLGFALAGEGDLGHLLLHLLNIVVEGARDDGEQIPIKSAAQTVPRSRLWINPDTSDNESEHSSSSYMNSESGSDFERCSSSEPPQSPTDVFVQQTKELIKAIATADVSGSTLDIEYCKVEFLEGSLSSIIASSVSATTRKLISLLAARHVSIKSSSGECLRKATFPGYGVWLYTALTAWACAMTTCDARSEQWVTLTPDLEAVIQKCYRLLCTSIVEIKTAIERQPGSRNYDDAHTDSKALRSLEVFLIIFCKVYGLNRHEKGLVSL